MNELDISSKLNSILSSPRFIKQRELIIEDHSLAGLLDNDSNAWKNQFYRNNVHLNWLIELSKDESLINEFIVLKGMSLPHYGIYRNLGERLTGDIDLLVNNLEDFSTKMKSLGFEVVSNHVWRGNDFKRVLSCNLFGIEVVVELHTRLFYHVEHFSLNKAKTEFGFYVLDKEDLLAHLVGHLAFQHTFLKFHWLVDIMLLIDKYPEITSHKRFLDLLNKFELNHSWKLTCKYIECFKNTTQVNTENYHYLIDMDFLFFPERSKFRYYIVKHLTKDHWLTSFRYNFYWLLEKGWLK